MQGFKIVGEGTLTKDPELKYLASGMPVAEFSLAQNSGKYVGEGETRKWETTRTTFVGCKAFGPRAEAIAQTLKKGFKVYVDGTLTQDRWDTKDGQKRSVHKIMVNTFVKLREPAAKAV